MAEAVNGLDKVELIGRRGPWRIVEQVELAMLEYVWWWNNHRLHSELDHRTPGEVKQVFSVALKKSRPAVAAPRKEQESSRDQSDPVAAAI